MSTSIISRCFILTLNLLIIIVSSSAENKTQREYNCITSKCVDAAQLIHFNINENEKPCNNFYNFACGGYIKKSVIPEDQYSTSHMRNVQNKVYQDLKNLLEEKIDPNEIQTFQLAKKFYQACTDELSKNRGLDSLLQNMDKLGGWPVITGEKWDADKFDVFKTEYKLRKLGYQPKSILTIDVFNYALGTSILIPYIDSPKSDIEAKYFKRGFMNEIVQAYYHYMIDVAVLLGANPIRAKVELRKALDLEKYLTLGSSDRKDSLNLIRISKLENKFPYIPWIEYINNLAEPIVKIEPFEAININDEHYIKSLGYALDNTPKRTFANYMIWKIIAESIPYFTDDLRDLHFKFHKIQLQRNVPLQKKPRWKECVQLITNKNNGFVVGISSMYIRKYVKNETIQSVKEIVSSIANEYEDAINVSWLDEKSKVTALKKIHLMRKIVGYPDELLNDKKITDYTMSLELLADNHYQNFLNLQRFYLDHLFRGLNKLSKQILWPIISDSTQVNAYYYSTENTFVVLAAIMQPPLFNPEWPSYMKYGTIGFIISHEIMHAYDFKNYMKDETGSLNPWMTSNSKIEFKYRIKCFIDQYNEFKDEKYHLKDDSILTLNENICDNVGLEMTYLAYEKWVSNHNEEEKLPYFNYTPRQLFWISAMNFLCGKVTPESRKDSFVHDTHTPNDLRAVGMLVNNHEFSKDFDCPINSPMNPSKKCRLW